MVELFKPAEPFTLDHSGVSAEIETNKREFKKHTGKLWVQSGWLDVNQARQFRDFLNEVIP